MREDLAKCVAACLGETTDHWKVAATLLPGGSAERGRKKGGKNSEVAERRQRLIKREIKKQIPPEGGQGMWEGRERWEKRERERVV